jgi:hypothetical protein
MTADGTNNGRLGLSIRRADRCNIARGTAQRAFVELQERGFIDCMKGAFSRKAPHATEWRLTWWSCDVHGRTGQQKVHGLGPRKTKRGIKISRRGIKSEPACCVKCCKKSLTAPSFDTVKAISALLAISI